MRVEHKTEKGNLLFIKVPDKFSHPFMTKGFHTESVVWPEWGNNVEIELANDEHGQIDLPSLGWQLIGLTSEITEETAKMMVDSIDFTDFYKHYTDSELWCCGALGSFKSLMHHLQVYEVNRYPNSASHEFKKLATKEQNHIFSKWHLAQEITGKWIVLFKPND